MSAWNSNKCIGDISAVLYIWATAYHRSSGYIVQIKRVNAEANMFIIKMYKYKELIKTLKDKFDTYEDAKNFIYESEDIQDKLDANYEFKIAEEN